MVTYGIIVYWFFIQGAGSVISKGRANLETETRKPGTLDAGYRVCFFYKLFLENKLPIPTRARPACYEGGIVGFSWTLLLVLWLWFTGGELLRSLSDTCRLDEGAHLLAQCSDHIR